MKVKDIIRLRPNESKTSWALVQLPKVQGQLIAINPNNGAIEAVVGATVFISPSLTGPYKAGVNLAPQLNPLSMLWL